MKTKALDEYNIRNYDLVIFDCDGTLVDSEHLSNTLLAEMLRELGVECDNQEIIDLFIGTSFEKINNYIQDNVRKSPKFDFEQEFRKRCKIVFEQELRPIEGVVKFIESLKTKICVASNGPQEKMKVTLSTTGLNKYFPDNCIFSAYDIQKWKPEPDLFLFSASAMDTSSTKSLVIEDTIHGAMGAIHAKMDVLAYSPDKNDNQFAENGIPTFASFAELMNSIL